MKTKSANRMGSVVASTRTRASNRPLARLTELFRGRAVPSYRMAPPLRNPHYLGLHIAAATARSWAR